MTKNWPPVFPEVNHLNVMQGGRLYLYTDLTHSTLSVSNDITPVKVPMVLLKIFWLNHTEQSCTHWHLRTSDYVLMKFLPYRFYSDPYGYSESLVNSPM